jgi:hypothetical protein
MDRAPHPNPLSASTARRDPVRTGRGRKHGFAISPRISREFYLKAPALQSEGAGNTGRLMRPQPRVVGSKHAR